TDVVRPTVAADEPDAFVDQVVGKQFEPSRKGRRIGPEFRAECCYPSALHLNARLGFLVGVEDLLRQSLAHLLRKLGEQRPRLAGVEIEAQTEAQAELGVVLEETV